MVKKKLGGGKDKVVSGKFETTDGAQTYLGLLKKAEPDAEFYIAEMIRGAA